MRDIRNSSRYALEFDFVLSLVNYMSNWLACLVDFSELGEHLPSNSSVLIFVSTDAQSKAPRRMRRTRHLEACNKTNYRIGGVELNYPKVNNVLYTKNILIISNHDLTSASTPQCSHRDEQSYKLPKSSTPSFATRPVAWKYLQNTFYLKSKIEALRPLPTPELHPQLRRFLRRHQHLRAPGLPP